MLVSWLKSPYVKRVELYCKWKNTSFRYKLLVEMQCASFKVKTYSTVSWHLYFDKMQNNILTALNEFFIVLQYIFLVCLHWSVQLWNYFQWISTQKVWVCHTNCYSFLFWKPNSRTKFIIWRVNKDKNQCWKQIYKHHQFHTSVNFNLA